MTPESDIWRDYIHQTQAAKPDNEVVLFILKTLSRCRAPRALDLGCGGGRHLRYMQKQGCHAFGCDSSPAARQSSKLPVLRYDVTSALPFRDNCFHLVLLWGTFLHLPPSAHHAVFAEITRVLLPGGRLLVDFLRPDDFRQGLGTPIDHNYTKSPWLHGVTDYFCEEEEVAQLALPLLTVRSGDKSFCSQDGRQVSQGYLWLKKPVADEP